MSQIIFQVIPWIIDQYILYWETGIEQEAVADIWSEGEENVS